MIDTFLACYKYVINVINCFKKVKVLYPMHMLIFSPHPFITAHPIDIHLGAFSTPPPLIATPPPRLFALRDFSNPPLIATPPSIPDWRVHYSSVFPWMHFWFLCHTRLVTSPQTNADLCRKIVQTVGLRSAPVPK